MPAKNAIVGEEYGTEFPKTQVPEQDLAAEKKAARFSKSKEFKVLKDHLLSRIAFYQTYLPDGTAVPNLGPMTAEELGHRWMVASAVVAEFKAVISAYEDAAEAVQKNEPRAN